MSDSQDKSDDLIAELAKLMATNAQGSESEPKPTVIKLAPLGEATVPPPAPIRIPGMDAPAAPAAAAPSTPTSPAAVAVPAPTIRIPGMDRPAAPAAAETRAPQSAWQPPRPPEQKPTESAAPAAAPVASFAAPVPVSAPSAPAPSAPASSASAAPKDDSSATPGQGGSEQRPDTSPAPTSAPATEPEHDMIADLIAAELEAAKSEPTPVAESRPAVPAMTFPASVESVPARTFGNMATPQAPVLVARPAAAPFRAVPVAPAALRPPTPQPGKPAENDRFAVSPVFGLGSANAATAAPTQSQSQSQSHSQSQPQALVAPPPRPQPQASQSPPPPAEARRASVDPMDEIENLIGEAVRVELGDRAVAAEPVRPPAVQSAPTSAAPAPVVPPLTTGFAPRRAGLKDNAGSSAEAAILAAAAATGAEVGRIDVASSAEAPPARRQKDKVAKRTRVMPGLLGGGMRQYIGMAVAATLLLAAGFGLYWVLGMGGGNAPAPVLTADATPAKQAPAPTAADTAEPARSVVFDEIDGVSAVDTVETLVSRDETAGASVAEVTSVVAPAAVTETTESGLANRKVRTVTVRPDGTIVSGDAAVAGTNALPVERPNVPAVPGASAERSDLLTAAVAARTDTPDDAPAVAEAAAADPISAALGAPAEGTADPVELALLPDQDVPPVFDASILPPAPMPRPTDRSALNAGTGAATSALDSLPLVSLDEPAAPAAAPASPTAAAYVQLSSQLSEADAEASIRRAQAQYGSLFNGQSLVIQRADLGQKGVRYRVRLPTSSLQDATEICASIKANGGDCFATRS